jgi:error-prone DNA polymerase
MGFYSPATIVEDAKRHDIEIRPIDVRRSQARCSLEPVSVDSSVFAVRMGLRYVKGLTLEESRRIEQARTEGEFVSLEDFVRRSGLGKKPLQKLAEAGALESLGQDRRQALWSVLQLAKAQEVSLPLAMAEPPARFDALDPLQTIAWDYRTTNHSPRGHPLEPLRAELSARGLPDARTLATMDDGARVRYAGLVICRQRPSTAGGVVFMTLEDETGFVNLVLWERIFDAHAVLAKTASFLGVTGRLQVQQGVTHLVAETLWSLRLRRRPASAGSRDFR